MARFDQGWVKLYRLHSEHWLEHDRFTKSILMTLIEWANYKDSPSNSKIVLKRGQVATSSLELAKVFHIGRQRIRTSLKLLQDASVINQQTNQHGTIVTICNYEKYQENEIFLTNSKTIDQPTANQRLTNGQPLSKELKNNKKEIKKELLTPEASPSGANEFIARYCEVYKAKYTTNPIIDGRTSAIAKRIVQSVGLEKSKALIEKYLQMHDQWFITKSHDLQTFEGNLNKVELFKETGQRINAQQAKQEDTRQNNEIAMKKFAERLKDL